VLAGCLAGPYWPGAAIGWSTLMRLSGASRSSRQMDPVQSSFGARTRWTRCWLSTSPDGCSSQGACNQGSFYDCFDAVVLFSVPREVLLQRIANGQPNPSAKQQRERQPIPEPERPRRRRCNAKCCQRSGENFPYFCRHAEPGRPHRRGAGASARSSMEDIVAELAVRAGSRCSSRPPAAGAQEVLVLLLLSAPKAARKCRARKTLAVLPKLSARHRPGAETPQDMKSLHRAPPPREPTNQNPIPSRAL
jgi:hypothetical protein